MFWSAVVIGMVGSLHCIGMCGPIVLSMSGRASNGWRQGTDALLYNFGRISTYAVLGLLAGLVGSGLKLMATQQRISVVIGVIILLVLIIPKSWYRKINPTVLGGRLVISLNNKMHRFFYTQGSLTTLLKGTINGLLPCGLVYTALAASLTTANTASSITYMVLFGLGTVPVMFGMHLFKGYLGGRFRAQLIRLIPVTYGILGVLLILRGLDLGIPFLSPEMTGGGKINCH